MLTHESIWRGIDRLAERRGMRPSTLAEKSGLNATSFNQSKRTDPKTQRGRWPSTESLSKILRYTRTSFTDFAALVSAREPMPSRLPRLKIEEVSADSFTDLGKVKPTGWRRAGFPIGGDPQAFSLEIADSTLEPAFFAGDVIVVSPSNLPQPGDRVVVLTRDGTPLVRQLMQRTPKTVVLRRLTGRRTTETLDRKDVVWFYRIGWGQFRQT